MVDINKEVLERRNAIQEKINAYNDALKKSSVKDMTRLDGELKDAEAAYLESRTEQVFGLLAKNEKPIKAAIEMHSYTTVSHKTHYTDSNLDGYVLVDDKVIQIDLVKFCKFCHLPTTWELLVERFNLLMAMRTANELKLSKEKIAKLHDSFYMQDLARRIEMGETPDSNTAICKLLQKVIDAIIFEDNGSGKNVYRVNNHDVAYLLMCYTKRGKKTLSVSVAKHAYIHRLIADIAHRLVTGKSYDIEYRMVQSTGRKVSAPAKVSEPEKVSAPEEVPAPAANESEPETVVVAKA